MGSGLACRPVRAGGRRSRAHPWARGAGTRHCHSLGRRKQAAFFHDGPRRRGFDRRDRGGPETIAGHARVRGSPRGEPPPAVASGPAADRARHESRLGGLPGFHGSVGTIRVLVRRPFRAVDRSGTRGARTDRRRLDQARRVRASARGPSPRRRGKRRSRGFRLRTGRPGDRGGAVPRLDRYRPYR